MGNAGSVFGICEACRAPRSEQDMICGQCGYHFKTKPVPAYPGGEPATRRTDPPMIVESARTVPTSPPAMTPPAPPPPPIDATPRRAEPRPGHGPRSGNDEAPRTMHSPSSPPVADRPVVPVAAWAPPAAPPSLRPRRSSVVPALLLTAALLVIAATAMAIYVVRARRGALATPVQPITFDGPGGVAFGHLDAAPAEDFVGRYLQLTGAQMAIYVGAFSGDDMHELWRAGPFDIRHAATPPLFAIVGAHVLVGDVRAVLHVHDGATGRETHQVELGDRATAIWVNGTKEAFIEVASGAHVLYDADAGRAKITAAPSWVPPAGPARLRCTLAPASQSTCIDAARAARFTGFSPMHVLAAGDVGVALGRASSGPPLAVLAFSVGTGAERWRAPVAPAGASLPDDSEVVEADAANVFATWGEASAPHLVAFAAKDGARVWETTLPRGFTPLGPRFLVVSPTRVYVPRSARLDVLDRATGALVGGVGPVQGK
jgi:outer membrane protein assembly factor BamB